MDRMKKYVDELLQHDMDQVTYFAIKEDIFENIEYQKYWNVCFENIRKRVEAINHTDRQSDGRTIALLGWMYDHGYGVQSDPFEANYWYLRAVREYGDENAMFCIAMNYLRDVNCHDDYKYREYCMKKVEHYTKILDDGKYKYANYLKGKTYESKGDYNKALKYYVKNYAEDGYHGSVQDIENCIGKNKFVSWELTNYVRTTCPDNKVLCKLIGLL
jgi:tetratricopeptide (TPR) repeat protein